MRFSYILHNKEGRSRRVPIGQAWQWIHELDDIRQLEPILAWMEKRMSIDRLDLMNVYLDHTEITAPRNASITFGCKSRIIYSTVTTPNRIIDMSRVAQSRPQEH